MSKLFARTAALLILLAQIPLLAVVLDPTGPNAVRFAFVGHPLLALGLALAMVSIVLRARARNETP